MPEQISRRSSIKIYESPLHRGSQHGSPAFRKKKYLRYCKSAGDCGQMSVVGVGPGGGLANASGCTLISDADLEIVSPPPRAKRASLPRKNPNPKEETVAEPDSSNISRERSKNESLAKKHLLMKRLPPKPPTTQIRTHQKPINEASSSNIVRNQRQNDPQHIYECIEFGSSQRQQSLPPGKNLTQSIQNTLKSVSLGRYEAPIKAKGNTLLQRLTGLRRSFKNTTSSSGNSGSFSSKEKVHQDQMPRRSDDPDWVYFRGFGGTPYAVNHGPLLTVENCVETPKAPPRRKRPQQRLQNSQKPLRRSLSFTDAHYIAQAVYEGDAKLIEELYPDFPRSEPIYAVVDMSKKRQSRLLNEPQGGGCQPSVSSVEVPIGCLPACVEVSREGSSARSCSSSEQQQQSKPAQQRIQTVEDVTLSQTAQDAHNPNPLIIDNPVLKQTEGKEVSQPSLLTFQHSMFVPSPTSEDSYSPKSQQAPGLPDVVNNEANEQWNNSNPNVLIECSKPHPTTWQSNVHPFAHRTQHRYATKKSKTINHTVSSPVSLTNSSVTLQNDESLEDSFEKIIRCADNSLHQAESILTNLKQRSQTLPSSATTVMMVVNKQPSSDLKPEDSSDSLGSDIEANIRKLEKTQAKINAALEAFRSIKEPTNTISRPLTLQNQNHPPHKPFPRSHSFRNTSDSSKTIHYEADVEDQSGDSNTTKDGSWSDSESGFLHPPIKAKLKGLLGTWGRNNQKRRQQQQQLRQHPPLAASISDPVPILQPPTATVSEYARRIEILAHDLSNGNSETQQNSPASSSGYFTPPGGEEPAKPSTSATTKNNNSSSTDSNNSSQRNSVSSESEEISDSEDQTSVPNSELILNNNNEEQNKTKAFYIANELMTSERVYVEVLRLLNVDFREFLQKARRESKNGLLPDCDYSRLFNNLPELQTLNEDLLQDFEARIANWSAAPKIADVIVKKGPFLKLYTTYIREFSAVNYHFEDCCTKFPKFAKLVKDFEKREACRNLKLQHFMLKPVQRLPQYKLLLEDYLRHLPHDSLDFDDTTIALRIVSDAAEHANNTIRQGDKFRRMLQLQSRLGDYFELIRPGRDLIKEGELQKVSRKGVGPRYFILLSDCLLYTTYSGSWSGSDTTSLRVSYQIPLSTLTVRLPPQLQTTDNEIATELHLTSPVRSFCIRAQSIRERNSWLDALNTAIEDHNSRKATFFTNDTQRIECRMGLAPPIWVPDRRVSMCQQCTVEFTVLIRRHHCRACGQVVCSTCSSNKAPLRYLDFDSARVCDTCFEAIEKELGNVDSLRNKFKKREMPRSGRLKMSRGSASSSVENNAQMSGYLRKKQKNGAKWKRFHFVLKDRVLYAYKAAEDAMPFDTFPILGFTLETLSEKNIELYEGESGGLVFQLAHPGRETLIFCADNDNICEKWMAAINEAVKIDNNQGGGD